MPNTLDKDALRARRATLLAALERYESGELTHYEEDDRGEVERDATREHVSSLRARIAEMDRQLEER